MQIRCKECTTEFPVSDEVVRVLRTRNGTVPCPKCRTPVPIGGEPSEAAPAQKKESAATAKPSASSSVAPARSTAGVKPSASTAPLKTSIWSPSKPPLTRPSATPPRPGQTSKPPPQAASFAPVAPRDERSKPPPLPAQPTAPDNRSQPPRPSEHAAAPHPPTPPPLPSARPPLHDRPSGVPALPAPVAARVSRPAPPVAALAEVPGEWLEPESEGNQEAATATPVASEDRTTTEEKAANAAAPVAEAKIAESASREPSPPEAIEHGVVPLASSEIPPARSKTGPPPLPVATRAPDSHETSEPALPTMAAAASSITIPEPSNQSKLDDDLAAMRRRPRRGRVVVAAIAVVGGVGLWLALGRRPARRPELQAATNAAKPQITAAAPALEQSAGTAFLRADQQPSAAPATTPQVQAESQLPAHVAAPTATPEPPEPPAERASKEPRSAKKGARARAGAAPAAPNVDQPVETELPDPGAQAARSPKSTVDDDALQLALAQAAQRAKGCHVEGGPTGTVRVAVTFAPSGDVTGATVQGASFSNTVEGDCIAAKFRALHIPPFSGTEVVARKSVTIQ